MMLSRQMVTNGFLPVFRLRVPLCLFEFSHEIPLLLREFDSRRLANELRTTCCHGCRVHYADSVSVSVK